MKRAMQVASYCGETPRLRRMDGVGVGHDEKNVAPVVIGKKSTASQSGIDEARRGTEAKAAIERLAGFGTKKLEVPLENLGGVNREQCGVSIGVKIGRQTFRKIQTMEAVTADKNQNRAALDFEL